MPKHSCVWLVIALGLIAFSLGIFLYLELINIDCDQFSCIGYFILLVPMFLLGVAILLIVLLVNIVRIISKQIKKN